MRRLALKICALIAALGVVAFVVEASRSRARELDERAAAAPAASLPGAAADAGPPDAGPPPAADYGIIGPATKADPHVMRRAAESLERGVREAPAPTPPAPANP